MKMLVIIAFALLSLILSACGTAATPVPLVTNTPTNEADALTAQAVAALRQATDTPAPAATSTPEPATATPAPEQPTEAPTEAAPAQAANDPVSVLASLANPARGEELFNTELNTASGPYRCSTCHLVDSETMLIGPGLSGIHTRGAERVPGESAAQYVYNSILHPADYVVQGYVSGVMPANYRDLLTDDDIYNIIAYLFTFD
jgi:hypothetical protein